MDIYPDLTTLKNYRDTPFVSQSLLKRVLTNNTKEFKETIPLLLGSYLDCLLTSPSLIEEMFVDDLDKRPSDNIQKFFSSLLGMLTEIIDVSEIKELSEYREEIIQIARQNGYQPKWSDDALWNSIEKESYYWDFLIKSNGKSLVTKEEKNLCSLVCSYTLNHYLTGKYFITQPDVDKFYQKDLYWNVENIPCKGLLDLLIIEHSVKKIYIVDIKSTSVNSIQEWFRICRQKNYPFQMSFYREGVNQNYKELLDSGYTIECRWMVLPLNKDTFKPWIIPCTDKLLSVGKYGYKKSQEVLTLDGRETIENFYPGWVDALSQYKYCQEEQLVDYDSLYFKYGGKMDNASVNNYFFI